MSTDARRLLAGLIMLAAMALAPATAQADGPTVPILNGGELHWVGSATRAYTGHSVDDAGGTSDDAATSTINWDVHFVIGGHYVDDPATPVPDTFLLDPDAPTALGPGKEDQSWTCGTNGDPDCPANLPPPEHCTWTERTNGASAAPLDRVGRRWVISQAGVAIRGNSMAGGHSDYSCAKQYNLYDPGMWHDCETVNNLDPGAQADACGTVFTFPDTPLEGAGAAIIQQFDHATGRADCDRTDDTESCRQTGHSTLTLKCALCVTDIRFQQPDLPGRSWADVPAGGTFDGNEVRVTATIHNATAHAITAPVRFHDLTTVRDLPPAAGGQKPGAQVSFPAGADTEVVLDWDTEGFAWYGPHKPDPHKIAVLTPYGAARRDLPVRPKPVLLVHGWNSGPETWAGYENNFSGVRSDWLARAATGMNTDPFTGNSIFTNARILGVDIDRLRDELDAEHVDLVVHSMGGLISRAYLHQDAPDDPDHRPVVSHLVMLGTPNRGSNCGTQTGPLAAIVGAGRGSGVPTLQLSPIYIEGYFNRVVTNTRGTKLSVLAGIAPIAWQEASLAACGLQTPNDLVVWKDSAFWTLSDTAIQDGLMHTAMTQDVQAFNGFVEPHLAVTPDGSGTARAAVRAAAPRPEHTPAVAAAAAAAAKPHPTAAGAGLALAKGVTVGAHAERRVAITVGSARTMGILVLAPAGVRVTLQDPRHRTVTRATSAGELTPLAVQHPRRGRWTLVVENATAARVTTGVGVSFAGDRFTITPKLKAKGKRLSLTVSVRGAGGTPRATATATGLSGSRRRVAVHLRRSGARFSATLKPMAGGTAVVVTVRGRQGSRVALAEAAAR